ncbi:basic proline-rich protein-like [Pongo pygmaeus]|uniref:basic proline-rich protein-like n=1 Tax=Pongo pygmaeus TaxID=9600 RepID=UPI00300C5FAA
MDTGPARPDTKHPPPGGTSGAETGSPRLSDRAEGGERRERARGVQEPGSRTPLPQGRPPGAEAADAQTAESGTISQALAAANGSPLRSPPPPPDPRTSPNEFPAATAARAAAPAPGLHASVGASPPARRLPSQPPAPAGRGAHQPWGQLGRQATAYAEAGGGGITRGGRRLHRDAPGRRRRAAPWTLLPRPRPRLPPRSAAEEPGHHGRRQRQQRRREQQHMTL